MEGINIAPSLEGFYTDKTKAYDVNARARVGGVAWSIVPGLRAQWKLLLDLKRAQKTGEPIIRVAWKRSYRSCDLSEPDLERSNKWQGNFVSPLH